MTDRHHPNPTEGEQRDFIFTATEGKRVIVTATYETPWNYGLEPCIGVDEMCVLLDTWAEVDSEHRHYLFPTTERSDDDVFIAYATHQRTVLTSWSVATESNHYSLDTLPDKLPRTDYTLIQTPGQPEHSSLGTRGPSEDGR